MKVMRRSFCGRNEHYNGFERRVDAGHGVAYGMCHCKDTCISKNTEFARIYWKKTLLHRTCVISLTHVLTDTVFSLTCVKSMTRVKHQNMFFLTLKLFRVNV